MKPDFDNPFVVASCHYTGNIKWINGLHHLLSKWKSHNGYNPFPGGLILKTISELGGDGKAPDKFNKRKMWIDKDYKFIRYTDGHKHEELLLPDIALKLFIDTKKLFPANTKIGVSILLGESSSYNNVLRFDHEGVDFIELNTKYLSRRYPDAKYTAPEKAIKSFDDCKKDIKKIIDDCNCPIWIKFARDIVWLRTKEIISLGNNINRNDVAFVFANTRQVNIIDKQKTNNGRAVVYGESLFPETFDIIKQFKSVLLENIAIVASGGVTTKRQAIKCLDIGADAIELCTYFTAGKSDLAVWKAAIR
jgi:dihydroorotate dehydrogenase